MSYVDGFVLPVPTAKKEEYRAVAEKAAGIFREFGATHVMEAWGDDVPDGKLTDFRMAVKATPEETVVFSWITWPSKAVRDEGMRRTMEDPRMKPDLEAMPFDGRRMIFGGFAPIVEAGAAS